MQEIFSALDPQLVGLSGILYLVAEALKRTALPNKFIPLILGGLGIFLCLCHALSVGGRDIWQTLFFAVTQGILCAATSVYCHQILKQLKKEE